MLASISVKPLPYKIKALAVKANAIAALLVAPARDEHDAFWKGQTRPLIAALIVREVIERNFKADLGNVHRLLLSPFVVNDENPGGLWNALREICEYGDDYLAPPMRRYLIDSRVTETIILTAAGESRLLDDPTVAAALLKCLRSAH
jgi:hypothetical protein